MSKTYNIAVMGGDGTGPEVVAEGIKVLKTAAQKHGAGLHFVNYNLGGQRYMDTGDLLPDSCIEEFKKADAIYLGAIGHPDVKPGILETGILFKVKVHTGPVYQFKAGKTLS